nr:immunoglobulin light chain junction region [Macaca mulatta]MOX11247.1 immunoglobulin light chain junction region [Macaca mulatta]MOX11256.1 immunoglobulin light chain junction region [Macaca mulatta]MOX11314.1 immunoglobulin light chain junction region [Macaca mulatta]MOX11396.1 immunoglobulin light chain junction region [Macaca mulatta]
DYYCQSYDNSLSSPYIF